MKFFTHVQIELSPYTEYGYNENKHPHYQAL